MTTKSLWDGIGGIVLDAVGTLIEPDPPVADVYLAEAARQGVVLDRDEVRARFGRAFRDDEADDRRGAMATDEAAEHRRWRRIVAAVLPEAPDPDAAFEALWSHFGRPDAWRCFGDVAPMVDAILARGLAVRIASNFDGRLRAVAASLPELGPIAAGLVISSEVGVRKPHPDFYRVCCERLGLAPGRVLFVGDDEENDLLGPTRAGLRAALVDRRGRDLGAEPGPRVRALTDLFPSQPG